MRTAQGFATLEIFHKNIIARLQVSSGRYFICSHAVPIRHPPATHQGTQCRDQTSPCLKTGSYITWSDGEVHSLGEAEALCCAPAP